MNESFVNAEMERLFATGKSRRLPPDILRRAAMRLMQLDAATDIEDLRLPAVEPAGSVVRLARRAVEPAHQRSMATVFPVCTQQCAGR